MAHYIWLDDVQYGPYTRAQVDTWVAQGQVPARAIVQDEFGQCRYASMWPVPATTSAWKPAAIVGGLLTFAGLAYLALREKNESPAPRANPARTPFRALDEEPWRRAERNMVAGLRRSRPGAVVEDHPVYELPDGQRLIPDALVRHGRQTEVHERKDVAELRSKHVRQAEAYVEVADADLGVLRISARTYVPAHVAAYAQRAGVEIRRSR